MDNGNIINTSDFRIEKNIIAFNDSVLQISNISHIGVGPRFRAKFNPWSAVAFAIGILGLLQMNLDFKILGWFFIFIGSVYMIWYIFFNFSKERYLYIYMNSGIIFYICCENTKFLIKVMKIIEFCINNHSMYKIKIDFDNCKLYNSPIIVGDRNEVN